ncbi:MAG: type II toxin-antitoxin system PemK/MazF family toxin [Gammaproteobacteria bacterium]|nr:type II toxin-antitoxin system PemK/MazF family toxin [Gammaproteobacteria bacterium]
MQRGEIWRVNLDPTAGHEQQGTRPVLIVSPGPFNELTHTPVVLPITSGGGFVRRRGFAVPLDHEGLRTAGVIRCDQPRALDLMARSGTLVESVSDQVMDEVLARLATILE